MEITNREINLLKKIIKKVDRKKTIKIECHDTAALKKEEYLKIIETIKGYKTRTKHYADRQERIKRRDILITTLLWKTAQRIGAMLHLKANDIDLMNRIITFIPENSKTGTAHQAYIDDELFILLEEYIAEYRLQGKHYLFFPIGYSSRNQKLSYLAYRYQFLKYVRLAGLEKIRFYGKDRMYYNLTPHTARAGVVTHLSALGKSPAQIMRITGHKNIHCMMRHYNKLQTLETQKELSVLL